MTPGKHYLSSDEIRPLATRSDLWGALLVLHCWGVIALALALFSPWPNLLTAALAIMIIGSQQLGFAILMHEAAHNALFRSRALNQFLGDWLCSRPILADLAEYRQYHLQHNRHTQSDEDPDLRLSKPFPTTGASLRRKLIRDITGQIGLKQRAQQIVFAFEMASDVEFARAGAGVFRQLAGTGRDCQYRGIRGFLGCGRMVVAMLLAFAIADLVSTCAAGAQYCQTWRG